MINKDLIKPFDLKAIGESRKRLLDIYRKKVNYLSTKFHPNSSDMLDYLTIKAIFEQKVLNPIIKYTTDYEVYLTLLIREIEAMPMGGRDNKKLFLAKTCRDQMRIYPNADLSKLKEQYKSALVDDVFRFSAMISVTETPDNIKIIPSDIFDDRLCIAAKIKLFYLNDEIEAMEYEKKLKDGTVIATESQSNENIKAHVKKYEHIIGLLKRKREILKADFDKAQKDSIAAINLELELYKLDAEIAAKESFAKFWAERKHITGQYDQDKKKN